MQGSDIKWDSKLERKFCAIRFGHADFNVTTYVSNMCDFILRNEFTWTNVGTNKTHISNVSSNISDN